MALAAARLPTFLFASAFLLQTNWSNKLFVPRKAVNNPVVSAPLANAWGGKLSVVHFKYIYCQKTSFTIQIFWTFIQVLFKKATFPFPILFPNIQSSKIQPVSVAGAKKKLLQPSLASRAFCFWKSLSKKTKLCQIQVASFWSTGRGN